MPDKIYKRGCGKSCTRCWINKLNHGSKLKIKNFPKFFDRENYNLEIIENTEYKTLMEEFHDKYIDSCDNIENINKIKKGKFGNAKDYNDNLFSDITQIYNDWLYKEKGIKKKIKSKDLIKIINEACKTANIKSKAILYYPNNCNSEIGYYLFTCKNLP